MAVRARRVPHLRGEWEVRGGGTTETLYTYEPRSGRLSTVTDPKGPAFAKATAGLAVVADDRGATEAAR